MNNIKLNTKYEILTPSGYKDFHGIRKLEKYRHFIIELSSGKIIKCSDDHPFILDGIKISANELYDGCEIDAINNTKLFVRSIKIIENSIDLYDIIGVEDGNIFEVDGIVSHNCDFLTSGRTVIDPMILEAIRTGDNITDPIERGGFDGNLWIWKLPIYDGSTNYIIAADVSRGDGSDYSAFHVFNVTTMEQVAEYQGKISTKDFGNLCVDTALRYSNALLVIENNTIGWAAVQQAIDRDYPNLFYTSKDLKYIDVHKQLFNKYRAQERKMIAGFGISSKTRPLIVEKMRQYFIDKDVTIHSKRVLDELFVFIFYNLRAEAMVGYNDDLVMSLAMGLWIRDTALKLRSQGILIQQSTLDHISKHDTIYRNVEIPGSKDWIQEIGKEKIDLTEFL